MFITVKRHTQETETRHYFGSAQHTLLPETVDHIVTMHDFAHRDVTEGKLYEVVREGPIELEGGEPVKAYRIHDDNGDSVNVPVFLAVVVG